MFLYIRVAPKEDLFLLHSVFQIFIYYTSSLMLFAPELGDHPCPCYSAGAHTHDLNVRKREPQLTSHDPGLPMNL